MDYIEKNRYRVDEYSATGEKKNGFIEIYS